MSFKVPLFNLNFDAVETAAVVRVLESKWISMGAQTKEVEERFDDLLKTHGSLAVTSCTAALHLAFMALGIRSGDEVIVPSLTFVASANSARYCGADIVFADITSPEDPLIDPADVERRITPRTKAILAVHYAGYACDMEPLLRLAAKHKLFLVEDTAHAPGAAWNGIPLGTVGDAGCFSFFSNKNISCGEGGLLTFKSPEVQEQAKLLRSHGMTTLSFERAKGHATGYDVVGLGYNYRIDDLRSSILLAQLDKLDADLKARVALRETYLNELAGIDGVTIPFQAHRTENPSNYIFPIILENADAERRHQVRENLHAKGIQTSVHYPAVHRFKSYGSGNVSLPVTEYVSDCLITLPLFTKMTREQVSLVVHSLRVALEE